MPLESSQYKAYKESIYADAQKRAEHLFPRIQTPRNREVAATVLALLKNNDAHDLKGYVLEKSILDEFDLGNEFGIDPSPLFNLNTVTTKFNRSVRSLFDDEETGIRTQGNLLMEEIDVIRKQSLLGQQTEGRLAYIRDTAGVSLRRLLENPEDHRYHLDSALRAVQARTVELLQRQKNRLIPDVPKAVAINEMITKIQAHIFKHDLHAFADAHPACLWDINEFCRIYADEIAQCIGENIETMRTTGDEAIFDIQYRTNQGVEIAYTPRNEHFLTLGDEFGDCTAKEVRSQVDPEIANIHSTVYPWLLDPYYRVLEVFIDGESVVKAHLAPLIIQDKSVLAIDALEAIPKMRDIVKGRKNAYLSQRLFQSRNDVFDILLESVRTIAEKMGVEQVIIEKFSNAAWLREMIDLLPVKFYHVSSIVKPFGTEIIRKLVTDILKLEQNFQIAEEIQCTNLNLWSQGLRQGYKEAALLIGEERGSERIISGP